MRKIIPTLKIMSYKDLLNCRTIDEALDEKGRLMLLYLTKNEYTGHWVCLLKRRGTKTIEYFDPYGREYKPDGEKKWLTQEEAERFGQADDYLSQLLLCSPYKIIYNKVPFQQHLDNMNTCGRHCICRLYFKHLTLPQYAMMVADSGLAPDDFVTSFVYNLIAH